MLSEDNKLKIADFGVSVMISGSKEMLNSNSGSKAYMPIEALQGEGYDGKAADIWAAGVTLY